MKEIFTCIVCAIALSYAFFNSGKDVGKTLVTTNLFVDAKVFGAMFAQPVDNIIVDGHKFKLIEVKQ